MPNPCLHPQLSRQKIKMRIAVRGRLGVGQGGVVMGRSPTPKAFQGLSQDLSQGWRLPFQGKHCIPTTSYCHPPDLLGLSGPLRPPRVPGPSLPAAPTVLKEGGGWLVGAKYLQNICKIFAKFGIPGTHICKIFAKYLQKTRVFCKYFANISQIGLFPASWDLAGEVLKILQIFCSFFASQIWVANILQIFRVSGDAAIQTSRPQGLPGPSSQHFLGPAACCKTINYMRQNLTMLPVAPCQHVHLDCLLPKQLLLEAFLVSTLSALAAARPLPALAPPSDSASGTSAHGTQGWIPRARTLPSSAVCGSAGSSQTMPGR